MTVFDVGLDLINVDGPDAPAFLQGQLSQDVLGLAEGRTAWSFLLQPTGKVDALLRVLRTGEDSFILAVDAGYGAGVVERLNRFKLRVKAEVRPFSNPALVWVREGEDGPAAAMGDPPAGTVLEPASAYERLRVERGWPAMGAELDEKTIPGETGMVPLAVSFTKGCYTGQELVARIDSRGGNVPRHLRHVRLADAGGVVPAGAAVEVEGQARGVLSSVAGDLALAYVHRDVEAPANEVVRWDGGQAAGTIEAIAR